MKRPHVANQKGEIAIAMLVSIVALISGLSMSMVAGRDATTALHQFDQVQELSLLRSGIRRGGAAHKYMATISNDNVTLPMRIIEMNNGFSHTTYVIKTKIGDTLAGVILPYNRRKITSMVRAFRTRTGAASFYGTRKKSPIETFGQKVIQRQTFASYAYLTNTEQSVNGDPVFFYGYDEIWGRVHSNTDIWLKNFGGWPTFHGHVSTAGIFQYQGFCPNPDEVFLDGYTERTGEIDFGSAMDLVHQDGIHLWDCYDIAFVTLEGNAYTAQLATFVENPPDTLIVYDMYPPYGSIGDSLGYNVITVQDTVWLASCGGIGNGSTFYVLSDELWIRGVCGGEQTWASEGVMRLAGDITYSHTQIGTPPDGSYGHPVNHVDYLGLVSNSNILIQYGFKDPVDGLRHRPNCDNYADGIYIYAALAAFGDGEPHNDGVFSFEYQYPHESTPNTLYEGEWYDNIDLHLGFYPSSSPNYWPWPAREGGGYSYVALSDPVGPDYPWYNPLWPEALPVKERGCVHLYGSVAQMRRGFMHRSGGDPLDTGWWDIDDHRYGPAPAWGVNAPGTPCSRNGIGYNKNYRYDRRFTSHPPPSFPEVNLLDGERVSDGVALVFQTPPSSY
ncbi:MAG: hypothetical protein K8R90_08990 [Candidatus Cloacimonetes bacterium]|nr:hypothetical protein [Candidatus Cloacimonadota bacterium]